MGLVKKFFYISCLCPLLGWADPAAQMAHSQAVDVHVINQNGLTQSGSGTAFVRKTKDNKDIVFILPVFTSSRTTISQEREPSPRV